MPSFSTLPFTISVPPQLMDVVPLVDLVGVDRATADERRALFDHQHEVVIAPAATRINVVNHTIGGRSSRTFQTEGRWDQSLAIVPRGAFVICQFGHNESGLTNDDSPRAWHAEKWRRRDAGNRHHL